MCVSVTFSPATDGENVNVRSGDEECLSQGPRRAQAAGGSAGEAAGESTGASVGEAAGAPASEGAGAGQSGSRAVGQECVVSEPVLLFAPGLSFSGTSAASFPATAPPGKSLSPSVSPKSSVGDAITLYAHRACSKSAGLNSRHVAFKLIWLANCA